MAEVSYGISKPEDLIEKLRRDGSKLTSDPHPDDVFNFFVTAAALDEWIRKVFGGDQLVDAIVKALKGRNWESLPLETTAWITDSSCIPNKHCDVRRHIFNVQRICWDGAGASKHFHWEGRVKAVEAKPIIRSWYQYFFTSRKPDVYIDYDGEVYGLSQIRGIVLQFYSGFLSHLRDEESKA